MATYKKRGFKKKPFSNKIEDAAQKSATANVFNTLDEGASTTEKWVANNQRYIFGIVGLVATVVLLYFSELRIFEIYQTTDVFPFVPVTAIVLNGKLL